MCDFLLDALFLGFKTHKMSSSYDEQGPKHHHEIPNDVSLKSTPNKSNSAMKEETEAGECLPISEAKTIPDIDKFSNELSRVASVERQMPVNSDLKVLPSNSSEIVIPEAAVDERVPTETVQAKEIYAPCESVVSCEPAVSNATELNTDCKSIDPLTYEQMETCNPEASTDENGELASCILTILRENVISNGSYDQASNAIYNLLIDPELLV